MDLKTDGMIGLRWVEEYLSAVTERMEERLGTYVTGFIELDMGGRGHYYLKSFIFLRRKEDHLRVRIVSGA